MRGKMVAITGAGRGIGLATARRFAESGALLALNDLNLGEGTKEVARETRKKGGEAFLIEADVAHHEEAEGFIREAERRFGGSMFS
jgi:3-oxoacyl-[acyl-carrier protein] reductase